MHAKLLTPSKTFTAADFTGEPTFTIAAIQLEDFEVEVKKGQPPKTERKGTITLAECPKPWVCNVTNTKCLMAMFGDETDRWVGKRVTLYIESVMSFGEWVPGVRIRGSPDIAQPVSVRIKLRKKKEQVLTMQPSGPKPAAASSAKPSPPAQSKAGPFDAMWKSYRATGLSDAEQFKSLVRQSTGKNTPRELTSEDVLKFDTMLAALVSPAGMDAPPPPSDEDAPF